jgi:hypothetical protein
LENNGANSDNTCLIEGIEYQPLAHELQKLPAAKKEGAFLSQPLPARRLASAQPQLPGLPMAAVNRQSSKPALVDVASAVTAAGTLVIDYELTYSGFPNVDGDWLPDDWEIAFFGSVTNQSAYGDPDSDGQWNYYELLNGTNPANPDTMAMVCLTTPMISTWWCLMASMRLFG